MQIEEKETQRKEKTKKEICKHEKRIRERQKEVEEERGKKIGDDLPLTINQQLAFHLIQRFQVFKALSFPFEILRCRQTSAVQLFFILKSGKFSQKNMVRNDKIDTNTEIIL